MTLTIANDGAYVGSVSNDTVTDGVVEAFKAEGWTLIDTGALDIKLGVARDNGVAAGKAAAYDQIRNDLRDYYENDREVLNEVLEAIGLEPFVLKWKVTVEIDNQIVLVVVVEADDETDAEQIVSGNLSIAYYNQTVNVDIDYDGDGEVEDSNGYDIDTDYILDGTLDISYYVEQADE